MPNLKVKERFHEMLAAGLNVEKLLPRDGEYLEPDEALKLGLCPECAVPLKGLNLLQHADHHWNPATRPWNWSPEAIRRKAMLLDLDAAMKAEARKAEQAAAAKE